jgi:hypothetical protein
MRTRSRRATAVVLIALAPCVFVQAQDGDKPRPAEAPPAPKADEKAEPAKDDKTVPADLARVFALFEKHPEPARSLERVYARALYYHLARDLDRVVECFHSDFSHHQSDGTVVSVPRAELRKLLKDGYDATPPTKLGLEQLVDFAHIRVYSKKQAHDSKDEGWHKEPHAISLLMADEDYLVIAPTRPESHGPNATAFDLEVFYVLRREGSEWKIVLAE